MLKPVVSLDFRGFQLIFFDLITDHVDLVLNTHIPRLFALG